MRQAVAFLPFWKIIVGYAPTCIANILLRLNGFSMNDDNALRIEGRRSSDYRAKLNQANIFLAVRLYDNLVVNLPSYIDTGTRMEQSAGV